MTAYLNVKVCALFIFEVKNQIHKNHLKILFIFSQKSELNLGKFKIHIS